MGVEFTKEQQDVIDARNCNLLVSAAAGSGKTAVLVERVITRLMEKESPLNVDQLLVVTFTDAAAAEMKERIRGAIEKALAENPDNKHLQHQAALIHQAQISTIHTFCTSVINEHFHVLGLDPSVRVGETGEIELIKREALESVFENAYAQAEPQFLNLVECYAPKKDEKELEKLVLDLYTKAQSHPNPDAWLDMCVQQYAVETAGELEGKEYIKDIIKDVKLRLPDWKEQLKYAIEICESEEGPKSYLPALMSDLTQLEKIEQADSFVEMQNLVSGFVKEGLAGKKKNDVVDVDKQNLVKQLRKNFQKYMDGICESYFCEDFDEVQSTMGLAYKQMEAFAKLVKQFATCFAEEKKKKNVIDFGDMEHFALAILTKEENGQIVPSDIAKGYQEKYAEVMIDEYQDINILQDTLLSSVSGVWNGKNNLFMVGDVKQCIYRFRLACPELFMNKYHQYEKNGEANRRIDLHKNFRSRKEVLDSTNFVFEQIMSEDFGGIKYDDSAALHVGAKYNASNDNQTELLLLDFEKMSAEGQREAEAQVLAEKIQELVGKKEIYDKKLDAYRPVRYSDIAILVRDLKPVREVYTKALTDAAIPIYVQTKEGYFKTYEIQTVLNYLRILDNPRQDVPYTAVLTSLFGNFTAEELAIIRKNHKEVSIHECLLAYLQTGTDTKLKARVETFIKMYQQFRAMVPITAIPTLLWKILEESGFLDCMAVFPNGEQRVANLEMLIEKATSFGRSSYKGLFNFVRYIAQMEKYEVDNGPANLVDEQMDVVTLMTIHKSKGLEFPIVFLGQCGNKFKYKSAEGRMVIHPDIGVGIEAINPVERSISSTLLKRVVAQKIRTEADEEEARLLYVAMTRAREKLFLLGSSKRMKKDVDELSFIGDCDEKVIPYPNIWNARSYLDWILLSLYRNKCMKDILDEFDILPAPVTSIYAADVPVDIHRVTAEMLGEQEAEYLFQEQVTREILERWDTDEVYDSALKERIEAQLAYQYPYENVGQIKQKLSVSELKKQAYMEEEGEDIFREEEVIPLLPKFLQKEEALTGASRGTAYHKLMEVIDFAKDYDDALLKQEIAHLQEQGLLTEPMVTCIRRKDILQFMQCNLGQRMQAASRRGQLHSEQPFVIGVEANRVYPKSDSKEMVLIQGIIDAYFEEDGGLVLMDYKTDRVSEGRELIERYHSQLEYYAEALERLTGKRVKKKIIYSFTLNEEIEVS